VGIKGGRTKRPSKERGIVRKAGERAGTGEREKP